MPLSPAEYHHVLWLGNHELLRWAFYTTGRVPYPITGKTIFYTVYYGNKKIIEKSTTAGTLTISGNELTGEFTPADGRLLAEYGNLARYEIEFVEDGKQTTYLYGRIELRGGSNRDV